MNRPTHFEIHAGDPERTIAFYTSVFGWTFRKWEGPIPYWFITTGADAPGINGGMVQRPGADPLDSEPVNAWPVSVKVASCDDTLAAILAGGGTVAVAKAPLPSMGWLAFARDPAGNLFGVMQDDPAAR